MAAGRASCGKCLKYLTLAQASDRAGSEANDPEVNEITRLSPPATGCSANNLGKIENMMHRVVTSIGYGYLNRLPLIHAFRWVDFNMMVTGLLKFTVMPDGGWQNFWNRFAEGLDVRLGQGAIAEIRRDDAGIRIVVDADGTEFSGEKLINTIPMHEFCKLTAPSQDEIRIAEAIDWGGYTTSMLISGRLAAQVRPSIPGARPVRPMRMTGRSCFLVMNVMTRQSGNCSPSDSSHRPTSWRNSPNSPCSARANAAPSIRV